MAKTDRKKTNTQSITDFDAFQQRVQELTEELQHANNTFRRESTERKRAEDWIHSLIETTQDAVISIDRQSRIVLFNPAAEGQEHVGAMRGICT